MKRCRKAGLAALFILRWILPAAGQETDAVLRGMLYLTGAADAESLDEAVAERFAAWAEHPLCVNLSTRNKLISSGLFSAYQAATLLDYRSRHGDILSLAELARVDGFGPECAAALAPFVSLAAAAPPGQATVGTPPEGSAVLRLSGDRAGGDGAGKLVVSAGRFLGAGGAVRTAYGTRTGTDSGLGVTLPSAYLSLTDRRGRGSLILGSYHARFGQGLCLWSGFTMSGFSGASSFSRRSSGLTPACSWASGHLTGVAADRTWGPLRVSAGLGMPAFRGTGERVWQPALNLAWYGPKGQASVTAYGKGGASGWEAAGCSTDFRACWQGIDGFAEVGWDALHRVGAGLAGAIVPFREEGRAFLHLRSYPSGYRLAGAAPRSASRMEDERGISLGAAYKGVDLTLDGAVHPAAGTRLAKALLTASLPLTSAWTACFKATGTFRDTGSPHRAGLRGEVAWTRRAWTLKSRLETSRCRGTGLLAYGEVGYGSENNAVWLRGTAFRIDRWEDRIYAYERDVPGRFTVPAYYGRGCAVTALARHKHRLCRGWLKGYIRLYVVCYPWKQAFGTEKPARGAATLQLSYGF